MREHIDKFYSLVASGFEALVFSRTDLVEVEVDQCVDVFRRMLNLDVDVRSFGVNSK